MRLLVLVRLITAAIAVTYGCDSLQHGWVYWLWEHVANANPSLGQGYSSSISPQEIGVYVAAVSAGLIVFVMVPRFRWGVPMLSWCLLVMGLLLLSNLYRCVLDTSGLSCAMEIVCVGRQIAFASPPLIIGLLLRYRFVAEAIRTCSAED